MDKKIKEKFMKIALKIAKKSLGKTNPNPMVGAIIVKNNKIISKGWHKKYGKEHAEAEAIKKAGKKAKNSTMFVTLEPCNHYGKQPPCTKAIIKAGIKEVYYAMKDPNKKSKQGAKELKKHGIKTNLGPCTKEAEELNEVFMKNIKDKECFFTLKIATTKDFYITWGNKKKKKITGKKANEFTQKLRKIHDAIIVGVNTIIKDNPKLTYKKNQKENPIRIILDTKARTPIKAQTLKQKGTTIIVTTKKAKHKKILRLIKAGAKIIIAKEKKGKIDIKWLKKKLYEIGICSALIEPGQKLASTLIEEKLFDKMYIIISQKKVRKGLKAFKTKKEIKARLKDFKWLGKDMVFEMVKK
ncbi:MAG: bifunctional diaminohydroxyphosphoribosylaminopyrimidine deaminase/5-amino-6-(5-phosphoribosylamino)uracil reductase RibD [Candidatus Diapherotrites archaeon]